MSASVMIIALALTIIYPDTVPLATYLVQPGVSALRDSLLHATRSIVNAVVWGLLTYVLVRVSERLRHKGR